MHAIGWRATLYSMLYVRHILWVRSLTIQPLWVPGTCRGFSFISDLFHVRFIFLNGRMLELLGTTVGGIEITDITTTKFLMLYKRNFLLQRCNIFLIQMYLLMENLFLCSFKKYYFISNTYVLFTTKLPIKKESQYIPAITSILFFENKG